MPRRTGFWTAWLAAALGCGDAAGVGERDAGRGPPGQYGRDGGGSCGDGLVDRGEACDGTVVGQSCESLGLVRGRLSCTSRCTLDTSLCGTDPRPEPPFRPDGGLFFDGGFRSAEEVTQACDQIVSCGAVPLPSTDDLFDFGLPSSQQEFCTQHITDACLDCALGEAQPDPDLDAGPAPCESTCRADCWDLSLPRTSRLFDPDQCVAIAADFVSRFDATCLCNACTSPLSDCLGHPRCHAAFICIDETGCQGDACSSTCAAPLQALSFEFATGLLDQVRACLADNGCQEP